jgi:hypothetical protein
MKKILLSALAVMTMSFSSNAQAYMEGFELSMLPTGWDTINLSGPTPGTVPAWFESNVFTTPPAAAEGTEFFASNYETVGGTGTISSWLFAPVSLLKNGDKFSYYSRTLATTVQYPDRMEVRLSTNGTSTNVGTTSTSVGDYSVTLGVINASLTTTGYPAVWTKYAYTLSGLPAGGVSGRIAFRYFVTNGGPTGANSDAIGVDSVYYKPTVAAGISSAKNNNNFNIYPNPTSGAFKITFATPSDDRMVIVQNMIGEVVFKGAVSNLENAIDLSSIAKGVYLINIRENNVVITEKLTIQ